VVAAQPVIQVALKDLAQAQPELRVKETQAGILVVVVAVVVVDLPLPDSRVVAALVALAAHLVFQVLHSHMREAAQAQLKMVTT
jgi:hypothetical protein